MSIINCPPKILALDLGRLTGWAYGESPTDFSCGTRVLATIKEVKIWHSTRQDRTWDPRIMRLHQFVRHHIPFATPMAIVFEDVEFSSYTSQTQMWASLRSAVWLAAGPQIIMECVPVGTLKKFATGHGGATKDMMRTALRRERPFLFVLGQPPLDDNAVDAAWVYLWAWHTLGRRLTS